MAVMYTISHYSPADKCVDSSFDGEVIATVTSLAKATDIATAYRIAYGTWTQVSIAGIDIVSFYMEDDAWLETWHVSYEGWQAMSALATPDGSAYVCTITLHQEGTDVDVQGDLRYQGGQFMFTPASGQAGAYLPAPLTTYLAYGWEC